MVKTTSLQKAIGKWMGALCIAAVMLQATGAFAQNVTDTTRKILLAGAHVKRGPEYIIKQANIVFPEILKGEEAPAVDYVANFGNNKRGYLLAMHEKGKEIIPQANAILKQYGLPEELSVLLMLESACNANVVSRSGAVGYWQIMDVVAKQYGLKYVQKMSAAQRKKLMRLNAKRYGHRLKMVKPKDERTNFDKSTVTAARYLNDSREAFNDNWLLVVASYNCGIGSVLNAIKKTGKVNAGFWDIKKFLPLQTQSYVMNFIALNVIYKNYDNFVANNLIFKPVPMLIPDNFQQYMTEELDGPPEN